MYNLFIDQRRRLARSRMHTVEEGFLPAEGLRAIKSMKFMSLPARRSAR
jgi:hypothetical protein